MLSWKALSKELSEASQSSFLKAFLERPFRRALRSFSKLFPEGFPGKPFPKSSQKLLQALSRRLS